MRDSRAENTNSVHRKIGDIHQAVSQGTFEKFFTSQTVNDTLKNDTDTTFVRQFAGQRTGGNEYHPFGVVKINLISDHKDE